MDNTLTNGNLLDTKKRYLYILVFGIALVIIVIIFVILQNSSPKAASTVDQSPQKQSSSSQTELPNNQSPTNVLTYQNQPSQTSSQPATPEDVTSKFYSWYLSYSGNPYASGAYKASTYLTPTFKKVISSFGTYDGKHDPIVCTVSKKNNFLVKPATSPDISGNVSVVVSENIPNGRDLYRAVLQNLNGKWLIDDFICIPK
jgi:hypothetical protein